MSLAGTPPDAGARRYYGQILVGAFCEGGDQHTVALLRRAPHLSTVVDLALQRPHLDVGSSSPVGRITARRDLATAARTRRAWRR
jgi:hypothetical protein